MPRKNGEDYNRLVKIAYLFPGQGCQSVGMGLDLYQNYPAAKKVFDQADDILGFPLSKLCFEGPAEELDKTENTQPAIFTTSIACLKVLQEKKGLDGNYDADIVAGHSLGELTSLVAAEVLPFHDALRLVRRRGQLMQEASETHPGTMMAVLGLKEQEVSKVVHENGVKIANINGPEQIVVSGPKRYIDEVAIKIEARGGKIRYLKVSGAFHSPLMRPAQESLKEYILSLNFKNPRKPILSNTSARPLHRAISLKNELVNQLCHCIIWYQSMEYLIKTGFLTAIEIGPGQVLSGILRRIEPNIQIINLNSSVSMENIPPLLAAPALPAKSARAFFAKKPYLSGHIIKAHRRRKQLGWAPSV